jgi:hypothetical protein
MEDHRGEGFQNSCQIFLVGFWHVNRDVKTKSIVVQYSSVARARNSNAPNISLESIRSIRDHRALLSSIAAWVAERRDWRLMRSR